MRQPSHKPKRQPNDDVEELYDAVAHDWARDEPKLHDDLIGRPAVIELARQLGTGKRILDLGCADGYVCRLVSPFAKSVIGVDVSKNMLKEAQRRTKKMPNISFVRTRMEHVGDVLRPGAIDLCLALYSVCSLKTHEELETLFQHIYRTLAPGGHVIVQVPHPFDSFVREPSAWFRDNHRMMSYFDSGHNVRRQLKTVNDEWVNAARYHHTVSEYINALANAGLHITSMIEPPAPKAAVQQHPSLAREQRFPASMVIVAQRA
jgi:SAM-dependent methyltransferase